MWKNRLKVKPQPSPPRGSLRRSLTLWYTKLRLFCQNCGWQNGPQRCPHLTPGTCECVMSQARDFTDAVQVVGFKVEKSSWVTWMGPFLSPEPLKAENSLRRDSEGRGSRQKVRETPGMRRIPPPQTVGTVWRHFRLSLMTGDANGTWQVEAEGAAKRPTMHRTAPQRIIRLYCQ